MAKEKVLLLPNGKPVKKSKLRRLTPGDWVIMVFVGILCFTMFYPFVNLIFQSISPDWVITEANGMVLWPKSVSLENYVYVVTYPNTWNAYKNTIFITVMGTALSLVVTSLGGYSLSKRDLPGRRWMTLFMILTMFIGGGMIPYFLVLKKIGLINTIWVLIIPGCCSTGNVFMMRNFFMVMPQDIKDSAYIDGAGEVRTFLQIVVPLSGAIIATMALFYGVGYWNTYESAIIYNNRSQNYTIQVVLQQMYNNSLTKNMNLDSIEQVRSHVTTEGVRAATAVYATLPIICVYPFLQKYFAKGVMIGSLKG